MSSIAPSKPQSGQWIVADIPENKANPYIYIVFTQPVCLIIWVKY